MTFDDKESQEQVSPGGPYSPPKIPLEAEVIERPGRGQPTLAWLVILTVTSLTIALPYLLPLLPLDRKARPPSGDFTAQIFKVYGKVFVAAADLQADDAKSIDDAIEVLNKGPLQQRLWFIVVVGELAGADEALDRLANLDARRKLSKVQHDPGAINAIAVLRKAYSDYSAEQWQAPSLSAADRQRCRRGSVVFPRNWARVTRSSRATRQVSPRVWMSRGVYSCSTKSARTSRHSASI